MNRALDRLLAACGYVDDAVPVFGNADAVPGAGVLWAVWRIIDVVIEGVSMVSNFRSQSQEILSGGGPERLLRFLREKNASGEPLKS